VDALFRVSSPARRQFPSFVVLVNPYATMRLFLATMRLFVATMRLFVAPFYLLTLRTSNEVDAPATAYGPP